MAIKREIPNYLDQTIHLLKEGTCHKRLRNGSGKAVEVLKEAEKLIDEHDLPNPWPQLVSYRLANVLLRQAKTLEDLEEIDELLSSAALEGCLGPLPRLHRLAVLSRLGKTPEQMNPIFRALLLQIGDFSHREVCEPNRKDSFHHLTSLQNNFFNMLELATYFTGYPYDGFDGEGLLDLGMNTKALKNRNPYSDLYYNMEEWRLVGTVPGLATTAYPSEIALRELETRMENKEIKPPCIAFKISADRTAHHWNFNLSKVDSKFNWIRVRSDANYILFLSSILYHRHARTRGDLLERIFDNDSTTTDDIFRSWKTKCAKNIAKGLKTSGIAPDLNTTEIFFNDDSVDSPVPELQPGIAVLGARESGCRL